MQLDDALNSTAKLVWVKIMNTERFRSQRAKAQLIIIDNNGCASNVCWALGTWFSFHLHNDPKRWFLTLSSLSRQRTKAQSINWDHKALNSEPRDFPGGPVLKNLLANTGDMSSISGLGTKIPQTTEQLSPHTTTTEPAHPEPVLRNKRSHCNEKPTQSSPCSSQVEKAHVQQWRPKNNHFLKDLL